MISAALTGQKSNKKEGTGQNFYKNAMNTAQNFYKPPATGQNFYD